MATEEAVDDGQRWIVNLRSPTFNISRTYKLHEDSLGAYVDGRGNLKEFYQRDQSADGYAAGSESRPHVSVPYFGGPVAFLENKGIIGIHPNGRIVGMGCEDSLYTMASASNDGKLLVAIHLDKTPEISVSVAAGKWSSHRIRFPLDVVKEFWRERSLVVSTKGYCLFLGSLSSDEDSLKVQPLIGSFYDDPDVGLFYCAFNGDCSLLARLPAKPRTFSTEPPMYPARESLYLDAGSRYLWISFAEEVLRVNLHKLKPDL